MSNTTKSQDYFNYLNTFNTEEVLRQLKHWHPCRRSKAVALLGELGNASEPVIQVLLQKLDDKSEDGILRSRAAVALGKLGSASELVSGALLQRLDDKSEDWFVQYGAAIALGKLSQMDDSIQSLVIQWIEQYQDSEYERKVIDALWQIVEG